MANIYLRIFLSTLLVDLLRFRPPLYNPSLTADADMLYPQLYKGRGVTMASRLKIRGRIGHGSGIIYNVHVSNLSEIRTMY